MSASVSQNWAGASPIAVPAFRFVHTSAQGQQLLHVGERLSNGGEATIETGALDLGLGKPLESALFVVAFEMESFDEHYAVCSDTKQTLP